MITRLAISGYHSLRDIVLPLGPLTVVTGGNGTGKSGIYRSLRLLGEVAQGRLTGSLAREGGIKSALWAGPERISSAMRKGSIPIQGTTRSHTVSLRLGFAGPDFGYAIDLGLPSTGSFPFDPEIKIETMWSGEKLGRANIFAERRLQMVRLRQAETGEWRVGLRDILPFESMVTHCADRGDGLELLMMRERMRNWRFYDNLRTDMDAPARRPGVITYTPVLADDGSDLGAAISTIARLGEGGSLDSAIDDAFPDSFVHTDDDGSVMMTQRGLLRPLRAGELSDGTLRYILLCAALLAPGKPEILVLNEPESSLHPTLVDALARLLLVAAERCQIIIVTHSERLASALEASGIAAVFRLEKDCGQTRVIGDESPVKWTWPIR